MVLVMDGIVGKYHRNKSRVDATGKDGGFDFNLCALNIF